MWAFSDAHMTHQLRLEPTSSLDVHVFLPNDVGGPGAVAQLVDVTGQGIRYSRQQHGPGSSAASRGRRKAMVRSRMVRRPARSH